MLWAGKSRPRREEIEAPRTRKAMVNNQAHGESRQEAKNPKRWKMLFMGVWHDKILGLQYPNMDMAPAILDYRFTDVCL